MKLVKLTLLSSAMLMGLSACTTTPEQCDPSVELNVFSKAACQMSGSYDKRIETKETLLVDEKATTQSLNNIYAQIKQQQNVVNQSKAQKQAQLKKLNKSVNTLTSSLKQKAQGKPNLLKQINEVEQQMKALNNSGGAEMDKQLEIQHLQSKLAELQQALGL